MKINKLNKKGFSAVEIVVALVVIVAVAGLGLYAFSNRNTNKSESSASTSSSDEEGLIQSDTDAEAVKASAGGYTIVGNAVSGGRKIGALVCTTGPSRLKVVFVKSGDKDLSTDVRPVLVFARNGQRTGQIYGGQKWWLGSLQSYEKGVGNHGANDTVKVEYNGKVGPTKKWSQIRAC